MRRINELLNNNKYRKIYESIIRAEILERLDAAKIECYYCERGYCWVVMGDRQEARTGIGRRPPYRMLPDGACYDILDDIIAEDSVIVNPKKKESSL